VFRHARHDKLLNQPLNIRPTVSVRQIIEASALTVAVSGSYCCTRHPLFQTRLKGTCDADKYAELISLFFLVELIQCQSPFSMRPLC
jgi:hypothetical protein